MVANLPPRIKAFPIVGALPQAIMNFPKLISDAAKQGDIVRIPFGSSDMYLVSHPDYLQQIMRDNHKKYARGGDGAKSLERVIGRGLIVLDGQEWLTERRMMQPFFHRKYFPVLFDTMLATIDEKLDELEARVRQTPDAIIDMAPVFKNITMNVFLRSMFGMSIDDELAHTIGETVDTAMRLSTGRGRFEDFLPAWVSLPSDKVMHACIAKFTQIVEELIAERSQRTEQPDDLLGFFMSARDEDTQEGMSHEQLRDECKTLIIGGYDTTSGTLMWVLDLLHQHPEVVNKLVSEADTVLAQPLNYERAQALEYTRKVILETLRLRPVSWANNRYCIETDQVGGYDIPANSMVFFPIMQIQRDPRWWGEDAGVFNPERWNDKDGGAKHRWAFTAFGGGPRVCLGEQFALLEATLVLPKLLQRFNVKTLHPEAKEVTYDFTMQPTTLPVRISVR